jgi:outer membrane autotransporter protein
MVGPYAAIRLVHGVYLDLRAAWGQSDNGITVAGDSGTFDTDRWLARANLTGTWRSGPWRFTPTVGVAYIEEQQDAYTTSGGTAVPAQDIALGRLSFGPEIAYQYLCTNGFIVEPQILLTGNWDFERAEDITLGGVTGSPSEWHATFAAGVMIQAPTGHALRFEASYGGIGAGDFEAFGARAWFNAPLN